ncbi:N-6 DNA methylase [Campylobacter vulpis]|uniref:N-6 DNA methylase n=1 Tax=Campylobacter vulpis TaxID=1655500 RepID=UPI001BCC5914|nr:N-6 DNA methylase [Campylobacter vulpis]MBS4313093.1 N-6 DNA methylase [Campylobacter vulpis]
MITKENLKEVLEILGFEKLDSKQAHIYTKTYTSNTKIEVDFTTQKINYSPLDSSFKEGKYPSIDNESTGFIIHRNTTTNFSSNENFVCLLCVDALLSKGYEARHIILEPTFEVGHNQQVYGDILVLKKDYTNLILIENKTAGSEFNKEWHKMQKDGGQLFSYYAVNKCDFLCLLAYDFDSNSKQITYKSHIITTKDNKEHLERINADLKEHEKKLGFESPQNANVRSYFNVWTNTYTQDFTTKGLLESSIEPYKVGKEKYNLDDLKAVPYNEIASIYHEFATILRNNAIGNPESCFYILVDLFLCKIIDEQNNCDKNGNPKPIKEQDLQFYYKGIQYDNPFAYTDRLLNLYEIGINTLFKKKVVNVKKAELDDLFTNAKREKGEFKKDLDKIFDKQKYFNIKKFNFIEVENEEEFYLNFKVLVKVANLIQDLYISQSENNQFLGDLFEGFLNRYYHQHEGRFFTPTPITSFIVYSLPTLKKDSKVLDFACGAGHFLTESIAHNKDIKLYGIEKNKDLSKVAKTACIIHDSKTSSNIIFQDALDFIKQNFKDEFEEASFHCILSNPPYSVKGFLNTLEDIAQNSYALTQSIDSKSYEKNNAIECFFIERAKQFLKEDGLLALVLPVSILQKGGIYEKTRELLFQHFKLLSIVELNKNTFGTTGTQTIILFAKKKKKYNQDLLHKLKAHSFNLSCLKDDFINTRIVEQYCDFMHYPYKDFLAFLQADILSENLKNNEVFKEYQSDYDKNEDSKDKPKVFKRTKLTQTEQKALFESHESYKNLSAQHTPKDYNKAFKDFLLTKEYKSLESSFHYQRFLHQVKELECEKLLYFSYIQDEKILILKSPSDKTTDNKSNKANIIKFLGYDWSKRKGDEGIKYQTTIQDIQNAELKESEDDSDEDKKQKEALRNINSVKFISTPLYNPANPSDPTKLCYAIKSFIESSVNIDSIITALQSDDKDFYKLFISEVKAMLDFSKVDFNKTISLNPVIASEQGERGNPQNPFENCKYELVKLGEIVIVTDYVANGSFASLKQNVQYLNEKDYAILVRLKDYSSGWNGNYIYVNEKAYNFLEKSKLEVGDVVMCNVGSVGICFKVPDLGQPMTLASNSILIKPSTNRLNNNFMFYIFQSTDFQNLIKNITSSLAQPKFNKTEFKNLKIPLPPLEIQTQIVAECERVEEQYNTIRMSIEKYQELIKAILVKCGIVNSSEGDGSRDFITSLLDSIQELESKLDFDNNNTLNLKTLLDSIPTTPPPQGWEVEKIGNVLSLEYGKALQENKRIKGDYPVMGSNGIVGYHNDYLVESPAIIVGRKGSAGKITYIEKNCYPIDTTFYVKRIKQYNFKLLYFVLQNLNLEKKQLGIGVPGINRNDIYAIKIPLPPLQIQEKIISAIESVESQIKKIDSKLSMLETRKAEILANALNANNERERERERTGRA